MSTLLLVDPDKIAVDIYTQTCKSVPTEPMTNEQREIYEERAAICEYHGGLTREEAEKVAKTEALKGEQGELGLKWVWKRNE